MIWQVLIGWIIWDKDICCAGAVTVGNKAIPHGHNHGAVAKCQ